MIYASTIVGINEINKILSYFPEAKRNFRLSNIYRGSRDGWTAEDFEKNVNNKGPTLIIL